MNLETPASIVNCIPGARATDIASNLKVLAKSKCKFSRIVIHGGANDIRLKQSEIPKNNFKSVCDLAKRMSRSVICTGPIPSRHGDEIYSRSTSLDHWLSDWCPANGVGFVDNCHTFWGRPGLLKRDGIHPSWEGAALLSKNLLYSLRNSIFWHTRDKARQQTYCPTQISACSQELLPRFHAIEVVSAPQTKLSLAKKPIRGVCMSNLKNIRPCYSTNNMDNQSYLKIGLI